MARRKKAARRGGGNNAEPGGPGDSSSQPLRFDMAGPLPFTLPIPPSPPISARNGMKLRQRSPAYHDRRKRSSSPVRPHFDRYPERDHAYAPSSRYSPRPSDRYFPPQRPYSPEQRTYHPARDSGQANDSHMYRSQREPLPRDMYHFQGRASDHSFVPINHPPPTYNLEPHDDFTFRSSKPAPSFPPPRNAQQGDSYRPQPPPPHRSQRQNNHHPGPRFAYGGRGRGRGPSDRMMLRKGRSPTPTRLEGMTADGPSFRALQDLSESEGSMDLGTETEPDSADEDGHVSKKQRIAPEIVPKWSNPDPYTSLPPVNESGGKKKDVVKLIRKAKVSIDATAASESKNLAADNADFISFDDLVSDAEEQSRVEGKSIALEVTDSRKVPNGFSHLDNLHPDRHSSRDQALYSNDRTTSKPGLQSFKLPPKPDDHIVTRTRQALHQAFSNDDAVIVLSDDGSDIVEITAQKRKRGMDDLPAPVSSRQKKPGKSMKKLDLAKGVVLDTWKPRNDNGTPWCSPYSEVDSMRQRFNNEIEDFYEFVRPRDFEYDMRHDLVNRTSAALVQKHPDGQLHTFGSFPAGLFLPGSDMDLVFVSRNFDRGGMGRFGKGYKWMRALLDHLIRVGIAHNEGCQIISGARVPIIKYVDVKTNLQVDISFENFTGVIANKTFQNWRDEFPAMPVIVTLVKQFLLMRGLNEVYLGGLGGFSITCLVTSLLQCATEDKKHDFRIGRNLDDILMSFFDFYGNGFDLNATGISMEPAYLYPKTAKKPDRLEIMDPNRSDNDISGGSSLVRSIFKQFSLAFEQIQDRISELGAMSAEQREGQSILGPILAGNYKMFGYVREQQRKMIHRA